jgi:hypothetical protein
VYSLSKRTANYLWTSVAVSRSNRWGCAVEAVKDDSGFFHDARNEHLIDLADTDKSTGWYISKLTIVDIHSSNRWYPQGRLNVISARLTLLAMRVSPNDTSLDCTVYAAWLIEVFAMWQVAAREPPKMAAWTRHVTLHHGKRKLVICKRIHDYTKSYYTLAQKKPRHAFYAEIEHYE